MSVKAAMLSAVKNFLTYDDKAIAYRNMNPAEAVKALANTLPTRVAEELPAGTSFVEKAYVAMGILNGTGVRLSNIPMLGLVIHSVDKDVDVPDEPENKEALQSVYDELQSVLPDLTQEQFDEAVVATKTYLKSTFPNSVKEILENPDLLIPCMAFADTSLHNLSEFTIPKTHAANNCLRKLSEDAIAKFGGAYEELLRPSECSIYTRVFANNHKLGWKQTPSAMKELDILSAQWIEENYDSLLDALDETAMDFLKDTQVVMNFDLVTTALFCKEFNALDSVQKVDLTRMLPDGEVPSTRNPLVWIYFNKVVHADDFRLVTPGNGREFAQVYPLKRMVELYAQNNIMGPLCVEHFVTYVAGIALREPTLCENATVRFEPYGFGYIYVPLVCSLYGLPCIVNAATYTNERSIYKPIIDALDGELDIYIF